MLRADALNVIYGPSGAGKTFYALDQSLCISSGLTWNGQEVEPGLVVYVAAEGASGLHPRIDAWKRSRGVKLVKNFRVWPDAVNLFRAEVEEFAAAVDELAQPPALIVFDTVARCMVGGDENSARDMGLVIDQANTLRNRYGAAIALVHHTGKAGELERGSSALRGAADAMVSLKPDGASLKLRCEKQKDGPEFEPWRLHLEPVGESVSVRVGTASGQLTSQQLEILKSVSGAFGTGWVPAKEIRSVTSLSKTTSWRYLEGLCNGGYMDKRQGESIANEYCVTLEGQQAFQPVPTRSVERAPNRSVPPHSFRSGTTEGVGQ